jgi:hypothetical protein
MPGYYTFVGYSLFMKSVQFKAYAVELDRNAMTISQDELE